MLPLVMDSSERWVSENNGIIPPDNGFDVLLCVRYLCVTDFVCMCCRLLCVGCVLQLFYGSLLLVVSLSFSASRIIANYMQIVQIVQPPAGRNCAKILFFVFYSIFVWEKRMIFLRPHNIRWIQISLTHCIG